MQAVHRDLPEGVQALSHHHREEPIETFGKILLSFAAVPVVLTLLVALVAGCFTVIWHIGHWVNWW